MLGFNVRLERRALNTRVGAVRTRVGLSTGVAHAVTTQGVVVGALKAAKITAENGNMPHESRYYRLHIGPLYNNSQCLPSNYLMQTTHHTV